MMTAVSQQGVSAGILTLRVLNHSEWPAVERIWSDLSRACGSSVFTTAEWVSVWINTFGATHKPQILVFENGSETVGACLFSESNVGLNVLPVKRISLNAAGEHPSETTYIEFNELLCLPEWRAAVCDALVRHLRAQNWDEFALDGFVPGDTLQQMTNALEDMDYAEVRHPSYYVDLDSIRASGKPYDSVLKSSNRKHLRQNIRYYAERGPLEFEAIRDVPSALAAMDELASLSEIRSAALGRTGVFSSANFRAFHHSFVAVGLEKGMVQILRLSVGGETIGLIYNLIYRGKVYFYQCGFRYTDDKRLSPGTVTLSHAIEYCCRAGLSEYDFLSGESKYKEWMSTGSRELTWAVFRRPTLKLRTVDVLRRAKREVVARLRG